MFSNGAHFLDSCDLREPGIVPDTDLIFCPMHIIHGAALCIRALCEGGSILVLTAVAVRHVCDC